MTQIPEILEGRVAYITCRVFTPSIMKLNDFSKCNLFFIFLTSFVDNKVTGTELMAVEVLDGDEVV